MSKHKIPNAIPLHSCIYGYDGKNGNGYQPCDCEGVIANETI